MDCPPVDDRYGSSLRSSDRLNRERTGYFIDFHDLTERYVNVISITANIGGVLVNGRSNISSSTPQTSYEINLDSTVQIRKDTTISNISITVN